jgi:hypothetical protein
MDSSKKTLAFVLTVVIVVSFFLPWINVQSKAAGAVTEMLTGKRQDRIDAISAYRIPVMANSEESRLMVNIIKIFNPKITNADKKSYLIWSVPILAVIILLLNLFMGTNKLVNLIIGIIGVAVFITAVYKIKTTDLDKLVLQVTLGAGLWLTLWSYLGLGAIGVVNFVQLLKKK